MYLEEHTAAVAIVASTDKFVTMYESATGTPILKTTCGEITTCALLSTNYRHLITASAEGIIYIWRLPDALAKAMGRLRTEKRDEVTVGEDKEEEDEFNELEKVGEQVSLSEIMQQI